MKGIFFTATLAISLSACAATYQSKPEAMFSLGEQQRLGLITKEQYQAKVAEVNKSKLPEKQASTIDYTGIKERHEERAKDDKIASITSQYNAGKIGKTEFTKQITVAKQARNIQIAGAAALVTGAYAASSGIGSGINSTGKTAFTKGINRENSVIYSGYSRVDAGAKLVFGGKNHDVFLGCLNCSEYDSSSISNNLGEYGSEFSKTSIFNKFSDYGSQFSDTSACNPFASNPPVVVDNNGNLYGALTMNQYHRYSQPNGSLNALVAAICSGS